MWRDKESEVKVIFDDKESLRQAWAIGTLLQNKEKKQEEIKKEIMTKGSLYGQLLW